MTSRKLAISENYHTYWMSWMSGKEQIRKTLELDPIAYKLPEGWKATVLKACTSSSMVTGT